MTEVKYIEDSLVGEKYKPGQFFDFKIAIPCVDVDEFALLVEHDGQNDANVNSMIRLADEGKAPYCVSVGVVCGHLITPDGNTRRMRMNSYDLFDREYGDFIVYELIPYIVEKLSLRISKYFSSLPSLSRAILRKFIVLTLMLPIDNEVPPIEFMNAFNFEVFDINLQQFERLVTSLPT